MTAPYYEDGTVTIWHADCRDVLPTIRPTQSLVTVTDPPYGVGLTTKTSGYRANNKTNRGDSLRATTIYEDDPEGIAALIAEVMPLILACSDRALVFCGPAMLWKYPEPRGIGCVYVPSGAGRSPWGFQCMTPILFYGKDPYLADGRGGRPNSFRAIQPNREDIDHPCPKPLSWMQWAVNRASRPGEAILDPFMVAGPHCAPLEPRPPRHRHRNLGEILRDRGETHGPRSLRFRGSGMSVWGGLTSGARRRILRRKAS